MAFEFTEVGVNALPEAIRVNSTLYFGGYFWSIGGYTTANIKKVYRSTDALNWFEVGVDTLPLAIRSHTSLVFDNKMWLIGGFTGFAGSRKVFWSVDGITWTESGTDALPVGLYAHASIVFDEKMWTVGGIVAGTVENVYWSSDGVTWTEAGTNALSVPSHDLDLATDGTYIYAIGGYSASTGNHKKVWKSSTGVVWTEVGLNALPVATRAHYSVYAGGKFWCVGGFAGTGSGVLTRKVYSSSDSCVTWIEEGVNALPKVLGYIRGTIVDGSIFTIGGYDGSSVKNVYQSSEIIADATGFASLILGDISLSSSGSVITNATSGSLAQSLGDISLSSVGTVTGTPIVSPTTHRRNPATLKRKNIKQRKEEEIFELQTSTLENIDWAFFDWVDKELDLFCTTEEVWEKTPVIWSDSERVFHIKNNKEFRDMSGTLDLPMISVRREKTSKSLTDKGPFFANMPTDEKGGVTIFKKRIKHGKTAAYRNEQSLDERGKLNFWYPEKYAKKVLYEYINLPQFVSVVINYKITIKTSHLQQMNTLLRPFLVKTGGINYFMFGRNGHKYEGFLPDKYTSEGNSESPQEEERFFQTTIVIKTVGYLAGADKNDKTPKIKRGESIVEVKIPREYVMLDWEDEDE